MQGPPPAPNQSGDLYLPTRVGIVNSGFPANCHVSGTCTAGSCGNKLGARGARMFLALW